MDRWVFECRSLRTGATRSLHRTLPSSGGGVFFVFFRDDARAVPGGNTVEARGVGGMRPPRVPKPRPRLEPSTGLDTQGPACWVTDHSVAHSTTTPTSGRCLAPPVGIPLRSKRLRVGLEVAPVPTPRNYLATRRPTGSWPGRLHALPTSGKGSGSQAEIANKTSCSNPFVAHASFMSLCHHVGDGRRLMATSRTSHVGMHRREAAFNTCSKHITHTDIAVHSSSSGEGKPAEPAT